MQRLPVHRQKIKVSFYPRYAATNKAGFCPVRIAARWHNQELLLDTGELIMPEKPGKKGQTVDLWDKTAQRVTREHPQYLAINGRLNDWAQDVVDAFEKLWDAAPFERITKEALYGYLFPEADAKPNLSQQTWRELLEEWKEKNRHLAVDSLRKYDQMATMMETWRPSLRPSQFTEDVASDYLNHLLDQELSDAAIKVHFTCIRKCLERLGRSTDEAWLQYSAKNAPQLDLEIEELRRLIRYRPSARHLAEERDRWLFQCFSGRRYEDLEKFEHKRQRTTLTLEKCSRRRRSFRRRKVRCLLSIEEQIGKCSAVVVAQTGKGGNRDVLPGSLDAGYVNAGGIVHLL